MPQDIHGFDDHSDLPWTEARRRAVDAGTAQSSRRGAVNLSLDKARDLVLAEDVRSHIDLPSFDTAAMDGWAVAGTGPWRLVGEAHAGDARVSLQSGEAIRISTGAVVPTGSAVLRSERGIEHDANVTLVPGAEVPSVGSDVRFAGEEVRAGEVVLSAGVALTPPAIGLAAAAGFDDLKVVSRPNVGVFILGDELVDQGVPRGGEVRDALSPQLPGWIEAMHGSICSSVRVEDSLAATLDAIEDSEPDVIVTTGGTARGSADHVRAAVQELAGTWLVDGVAVRPGHPMKLGILPAGTLWLALPGNPLAAVSALVTLGEPLLAALSGRITAWVEPEQHVRRPLAGSVECSPGAHRLIPAQIVEGLVHPALRRGPAMLSGLASADVFAVVPPGPSPLPAGADVAVLPLPWGSGLVV
ncbi:MAG: molybdopterin molybdotransferase MoeA [Actinomycetes bacterium]